MFKSRVGKSTEPAVCLATNEQVEHEFWEATYHPAKEPSFTKRGKEIGCSKRSECDIECFWTNSNDKSKDYLKVINN